MNTVYVEIFKLKKLENSLNGFINNMDLYMRMEVDDASQVFYWADDDTDECLSPRFDCEEDAILWYGNVARQILSEFGVEKGPL